MLLKEQFCVVRHVFKHRFFLKMSKKIKIVVEFSLRLKTKDTTGLTHKTLQTCACFIWSVFILWSFNHWLTWSEFSWMWLSLNWDLLNMNKQNGTELIWIKIDFFLNRIWLNWAEFILPETLRVTQSLVSASVI